MQRFVHLYPHSASLATSRAVIATFAAFLTVFEVALVLFHRICYGFKCLVSMFSIFMVDADFGDSYKHLLNRT